MRRDWSFARLTFHVLLAGALIVCTAGVVLAQVWRTYHNDRYGTTIDYQDDFKPGDPPDANDGLSFASADGASFSVFASYNALDFDLAGYRNFIVKDLAAGKVITYQAHGDNWFVISGTAGSDHVFYEKYLLSHSGEMTEGFVMSYPSVAKQKYDPIVARLAKSFRPGSGFQTPDKP